MLFGKVQLTSTVQMLHIITLTRPIPPFTNVKTGPERSDDMPKIAQLAGNQARADLSRLRSPDLCPRQTVILCSSPTEGKELLPFPCHWHGKLEKESLTLCGFQSLARLGLLACSPFLLSSKPQVPKRLWSVQKLVSEAHS